MNDPLSSLSAPPPRYLLESDSSDEEGRGEYISSHSRRNRTRSLITKPEEHFDLDNRVEFHPFVSLDGFESVTIAIGQASRYLLNRVSIGSKVVDVRVGSKALGSGFKVGQEGEDMLLLVDEPDEKSGAANDIAAHILGMLSLKCLTVISIYVPSMYIPDPAKPILTKAPIRHLSLSETSGGLESFDGPNFVSGIAGALLSLAVHPSTALLTNFNILLLPLPLSSLPPTSLPSALTSIQSKLRLSTRSRWSEDDDEPFFTPGQGISRIGKDRSGRRNPVGNNASTVDLTNMYM